MIAALFFLAYAAQVRSAVRREKRSYGVPDGIILYSDLNVPAAPLFSPRLRLSGKPDYIIQRQDQYIPVEVKSGRGAHPHHSQVLQLATYCQLLEDVSGVFVPEGILVFNHTPHRIPFDPGLRFELESVINTMRVCLRTGRVQRNHQDPRRCQRCSMKQYCTDIVHDNV
ncbi:MAG: Dna2/Cas4 domain-containing protein [Candidatus Thermoplasmatota archaeon]|nr:Dna2/Cas4 domain-containing protein [Candidatus Thermoplasmatota archaeon]